MRTISNYIYSFFWWFSGTNKEFIKLFPTEHQKYFHIGATIFITWIIATIGGISLFSFVFLETQGSEFNTNIPYILGVLWGIVILNIDRYMIVTIKKRGTSLITNLTRREKLSNFMGELYPAIPRFFIAFIIGIFISTPLELKLFEEDIKNYEESLRATLVDKSIEKIKIKYNKEEAKISEIIDGINIDIKSKVNGLNRSKENKETRIKEIVTIDMKDEKNGVTGSKGNGERFKKLQNNLDILREERDALANKIDDLLGVYSKNKKYLSTEIETLLRNRYENRIKREQIQKNRSTEFSRVSPEIKNLSSKIQILEIAKKDEGNSTIYWTDFILKLFIIILETSPILFKLLSLRGPVESYIDKLSSEAMIEHDMASKKARNHSIKKW